MYSSPIIKLISALKKLPSVGERTAERYVFHWLKSGKKEVTELMLALKELIENIKSCEVCWNFSDKNPCIICEDKKRDHSMLCVVTDPQDVYVVEKTGAYHGVYHVLRYLVDPTDPDSLAQTKIKELLLKTKDLSVKEIILALNSDINGETTMLYLEKEIKNCSPQIKVSRLARGLPLGADLRYADEITLTSAINHRVHR